MPTISFAQALARSQDSKRHFLLGNGFSIALFPNRFQYERLLDTADFVGSPEARAAFDRLGTTDFEVVIKGLQDAVALLPLYTQDEALTGLMRQHAEALKGILVNALAGRHPARPSDITEGQCRACRTFLAQFVGDGRGKAANAGKDLRGCIYTVNYDLLLYWTLLHDQIVQAAEANPLAAVVEPAEPLLYDDGFRAPEDEPDAPYVTWDAEGAADNQNIHFLHGGLHLFDAGPVLQKKCWEGAGGVPLIDQIRAALDESKFPLFVSEGDTNSKLTRIRHSGYLQRSLKSFAGVCKSPSASLFIFGHALAANDEHVVRQIEKGKCRRLFVSLYGPAAEPNRAMIARSQRIADTRGEKHPLEMEFFDAASAEVWG
jgi:hypothetical protein